MYSLMSTNLLEALKANSETMGSPGIYLYIQSLIICLIGSLSVVNYVVIICHVCRKGEMCF